MAQDTITRTFQQTNLANESGEYLAKRDELRLAEIELDYVVLIGSTNPQEARRLFTVVKQRTSTNSPVFPRVKRLEKTYQ